MKLLCHEPGELKSPEKGESMDVYRARLVKALADELREHGIHGFAVARISKARFGIVDRDRMNYLGLSFEVDMVEPSGGGAFLHLMRDESLLLLEKIGDASNLNGKLCWVYTDGGYVRFVRMVAGEVAES